MTTLAYAIIIPAHDEEAVIERCLAAILDTGPVDAVPEVIVVANGCTDATARVARAYAPWAHIVELSEGSKALALNAGNAVATVTPRLIMDADVMCSRQSLDAVCAALAEPGALVASPALRVDTSRCDRFVQAYYRVWMTQPYVTDRLVGGGVYGLSAEAIERLGEFPPVFADDFYVRTRFSFEERRSVSHDAQGRDVFVTVWPPRTVLQHVRIEARRRRGADEISRLYPAPGTGAVNRAGDLRSALAQGASAFDVAVYLAMKLAARLLLRFETFRGREARWTRDASTRETAS